MFLERHNCQEAPLMVLTFETPWMLSTYFLSAVIFFPFKSGIDGSDDHLDVRPTAQ